MSQKGTSMFMHGEDKHRLQTTSLNSFFFFEQVFQHGHTFTSFAQTNGSMQDIKKIITCSSKQYVFVRITKTFSEAMPLQVLIPVNIF